MEILLPILLADALNPVLLAALIYAAGCPRGVVISSLVLLGHTSAYLGAGVLLLFGFERLGALLANPGSLDYTISALLGLLLLWVAWRSRQATDRADEGGRTPPLTPAGAFGFGAVVNFIGLPFALPYFAAVDQIIKAGLTGTSELWVLLVYNVAYAAPFTLVPVLTATLGDRSQAVLSRINDWVSRGSAVLMPVMLGLVGLALIADALSFFMWGKGLF